MHKILVDYALPFHYEALEPYLSREIIHFHFDKHTLGYIKRYNDEIGNHADLVGLDFIAVMQTLVREIRGGSNARLKLFQDGAQAWNHYVFWSGLTVSQSITVETNDMLAKSFGSLAKFKEDFVNAGKGRFGSGWIWLVRLNNVLELVTTHDADAPIFHLEPLVTLSSKPVDCLVDQIEVLSVCDLWEHSYYLQYKNDRESYLRHFIDHLMNWNLLDPVRILEI